MGEIIACANQKGGVGKTTTVVNLGAYLALAGRRVLILDLDPQGNATRGFGIERDSVSGSAYDLLTAGGGFRALTAATTIPGLMIIVSARDLSGLDIELITIEGREYQLARALTGAKDAFDHVLIDCPPSLGLLTVNALTAADSMMVPLQCEYYALEGLSQSLATMDLVRQRLNPHLRLKGVVLTMFDARTTLSSDVLAEVRRHLPGQVFDTIIPRSVRLAEAPGYGRPVALYSPTSRGAQAYQALALEMLARDQYPTESTDLSSTGAPAAVWVTSR